MQGDKLFPGLQNVIMGGLRLGAPDRQRGDGALDAGEQVGKSAANLSSGDWCWLA